MRAPSLLAIVAAFLLLTALAPAQERVYFENNLGPPGIHLVSQSPESVEIVFSLPFVEFSPRMVKGERFTQVVMPGALLGNDPGAPNLPGLGRYIALPRGAAASVEIVESRSRVFEGMNILPAPPLPRENDDSPPVYVKDPAIYGRDATYPAEPVRRSDPLRLRGVDAMILGITPFGYNPVQRKLTVYSDLRIKVTFEGGRGRFGEDSLRNRWFEPLLHAHLLNYASLPPVNFDRPTPFGPGGRESEECEYMIFVPDDPDFIAWAEQIKAFRIKQGITTRIFNLGDIGNSAAAIQNKIDYGYHNWSLKPVAALMLGDLPDMPVFTWNSYCLSDNIYADVDGDDLPDLNVARITARNATELQRMVEKFLDYETNPPVNPGFYDNPIVAGGWQTERWFILCTEVCYGFLNHVLGKRPVREYAIYSGTPGSVWSTATNTNLVVDYFGPNGLGYIPATPSYLTDWGGNATRINADINDGAFYMLHRDHGYEEGWGEPQYNIGSLSGLHNDDLCFVMSINCLTGKYDYSPQSFAEAFHRMTGGALGLIAASNVSYSFVNDTFVWGMHDALWPAFDPGYGGTTGENVLMPGFAMASGKWYLAASNWPYNTSNKDETYNLFHMHGDAFTQLYSEVPQNLTVSHASQINTTATSFDVSADADALIALSMGDRVLGTGTGTGGMTTIPIEPPGMPGIMYVTVTKPNYYRYEGQVVVNTGGALAIWPPDGTPDTCLPGPHTKVTVKIVDGLEHYVPGTGMVHYRFDSTDPYTASPLTPLGNDLYEADIPGAAPQTHPAFYFSAQGDGGTTVTCPDDAPNTVFSMTVEPLEEVVFHDDFEADLGWSVTSYDLQAGEWERGIPIGGGDRGDPPTDFDGTGQCYLTENVDGDSDVDGGPTILFSPVIDLSSGDAQISYARWHSNDDNDDPFTVEISSDGGSSWTQVEQVKDTSGWNVVTFTVSDFVSPTSQVRMRFSSVDNPNNSVTESGLDAFWVKRTIDDASLWADHYALSCVEGAVVEYFMDAGPGNANRGYLLLASLTGSTPGFNLPGGKHVPLNWDAFTNFLVANLGGPVFQNFLGTLDGLGKSTATFDTLGAVDPVMVGQTLTFAYILAFPPAWDFVSNPVYLEMQP